MRMSAASSPRSAAVIVAIGSPRLAPNPSSTSTTRPLDRHADVFEHRVDGGGGFADLDHDALDQREGRQHSARDRFCRRLDQIEPLRGQRLGHDLGQRIVADGLRVVVAPARRAQVEMGHHVHDEALPEPLLLRQDAVAGEGLQTFEDDAVAHAALRMASSTLSAWTWAATSCARTMSAPWSAPWTWAAIVPGPRSSGGGGGSNRLPMKRLRDAPSRTGKPSALSRLKDASA